MGGYCDVCFRFCYALATMPTTTTLHCRFVIRASDKPVVTTLKASHDGRRQEVIASILACPFEEGASIGLVVVQALITDPFKFPPIAPFPTLTERDR
jgi:hypothetical protein